MYLNTCPVNLETNFAQRPVSGIKILSMEEFIVQIEKNLLSYNKSDLLLKFFFHQGWLEGHYSTTSIHVLQERTSQILKQLIFEWPPISADIFNRYIDSLPL